MVKTLFSYHGRINRAQYWGGGLIVSFIYMFAWFLCIAPMTSGNIAAAGIGALFGFILFCLCIWCSMSLHVKRLHDRGRTGYLALLFLLPILTMVLMLIAAITKDLGLLSSTMLMGIVNFIISIFFFVDLGLLPSKEGPNRFGEPPGGGVGAAPPSVRPAANTNTPPALGNADLAMQRAIDAQSRMPNVVPRAAPAQSATGLRPTAQSPQLQAQMQAKPPGYGASPAPKAFGRR